jgi:hypothetical protein
MGLFRSEWVPALKRPAQWRAFCYSNSIVPGGFEVQS